MRVLVVAAHSDDETIGCGGTIYNYTSRGDRVYVCFISDGMGATDTKKIKLRKAQAQKAADVLGVQEVFFNDLPDQQLDTIPYLNINRIIEKTIEEIKPEIVYTHSKHDLNSDHTIVHDCTLVAARKIQTVISYEIVGSTTSDFHPNFYMDVSESIELKKKAVGKYKLKNNYPYMLDTLAKYRGISAGCKYAEGFEIVRLVRD